MEKVDNQKNTVICRVCLDCDSEEEQSKGLSLFEEYNDSVISDKINALTNVGIEEGDGLPDRICPTCLLELESAFKFKLKCESSHEVLLSAVNNIPTQQEGIDDVVDLKKEEYLEDDNVDNDDEDDSISLAEFATAADAPGPRAETPPRSSRAINLKLECHDCGGSFTSKCKLRVHWKKAHMPEKLKCPNCFRKFKTYATLNLHKKRNLKSCVAASKVRIEGDGRNRVFYCIECNYHTVQSKLMTVHILRHTGERPFQCDICSNTFTQRGTLISHKENIHKLYTGEGACPICGKHIQGRIRLSAHIRRHKRKDNVECIICKMVLKSKEILKNHMKRHSGVKTYICEFCSKSYYTASELCNHRAKHSKMKTYICEYCSYSSKSNCVISRHKKKHSASNVACNVCGCFLDNERQLALHKNKHTNRNHQCTLCEKTFHTRKNLGSHHRQKHKIVMLSGRAAHGINGEDKTKTTLVKIVKKIKI